MNNPTISIIIPTFNPGEILSIALDSIIKQRYRNFEVLIIDSASNDQSIDIIRQYIDEDTRFRLISENDDGIYDAMNKGIEMSKGEWIFFLGSDDSLYNENVLSDIAEVIKKAKSSKFIYGNVKRFKNLMKQDDFVIYNGRFDENMLLSQNICHQSIFYHRSLFQQFGLYNINYKLQADWDFNLRCFNRSNPFFCDMIISNYHAGGRSSLIIDQRFHNEFLKNLIFNYPYHYGNAYFKKKKRLVMHLLFGALANFNLKEAYKALRVLRRQIFQII